MIALATAGAQVVCACPNPALHQAPPPRACASDKDCCKTLVNKPVQPPKEQPCGQCNLKHRSEQAMPDRHTDAAPQISLVAIAFIALPASNNVAGAEPRPFEIFESPPLLNDLFHVHSLLLN